MNVLMLHELRKFLLLLIPEFILTDLTTLPAAIIITLIPYTPINILVFMLVFLIIYFTGIFGLGRRNEPYCRYNQLETRTNFSLWQTIKQSYFIYFLVAFLINYNNIFVFQSQASNILHSI